MNPIHITETDRAKLSALLAARRRTRTYSPSDDFLAAELERARIVAPDAVPADVVTMNSEIRVADAETGEIASYRLVFPEDADIFERKISVLSPVGAALLGYRAGDTFRVPAHSRARTLTVTEILHQPESAGVYD